MGGLLIRRGAVFSLCRPHIGDDREETTSRPDGITKTFATSETDENNEHHIGIDYGERIGKFGFGLPTYGAHDFVYPVENVTDGDGADKPELRSSVRRSICMYRSANHEGSENN